MAYVPSAVDEENAVTVGKMPSTTKAFEPARLLAPLGTVVDVIALPAASRTVPIVNDETVKSDDELPEATVYVPVKDVPAEAAVNTTVVPVSSVTVNVFPDCTASLAVAVMLIVEPTLYVPSAVEDENVEIVGN